VHPSVVRKAADTDRAGKPHPWAEVAATHGPLTQCPDATLITQRVTTAANPSSPEER
jgi:hypothetical protein